MDSSLGQFWVAYHFAFIPLAIYFFFAFRHWRNLKHVLIKLKGKIQSRADMVLVRNSIEQNMIVGYVLVGLFAVLLVELGYFTIRYHMHSSLVYKNIFLFVFAELSFALVLRKNAWQLERLDTSWLEPKYRERFKSWLREWKIFRLKLSELD